jgi:hypothetical protein
MNGWSDNGLMFITCIIKRIRNNKQYALICNIPLFYVLAPTCFGISLPPSGSFLDPSELLEIHIEWVVYHITCGYMACVPDCRVVVCCAYMHSAGNTERPAWESLKWVISSSLGRKIRVSPDFSDGIQTLPNAYKEMGRCMSLEDPFLH